jgi:hypothetical protein
VQNHVIIEMKKNSQNTKNGKQKKTDVRHMYALVNHTYHPPKINKQTKTNKQKQTNKQKLLSFSQSKPKFLYSFSCEAKKKKKLTRFFIIIIKKSAVTNNIVDGV